MQKGENGQMFLYLTYGNNHNGIISTLCMLFNLLFFNIFISSIIKLYDFVWQNLIRSNGLYVFLNSFGNPCPLSKYDLLEEKNRSCLLHNLLYMDVFLIFTLTSFHQKKFSIFCCSVTNEHPKNDLTIISKFFL